MVRRRRKPAQGQLEDELLAKGRWRQYREQLDLQQRNHSVADNLSARRGCRQLLSGGYGAMEPDQHGGFPF